MSATEGFLTDETVHEAANRLRQALQLAPLTSEADRADLDTILAWIARETEIPAAYRRADPQVDNPDSDPQRVS